MSGKQSCASLQMNQWHRLTLQWLMKVHQAVIPVELHLTGIIVPIVVVERVNVLTYGSS